MAHKERIIILLKEGVLIPKIYEMLDNEFGLDMTINTFRLYAYEIRNEIWGDDAPINNVSSKGGEKKTDLSKKVPDKVAVESVPDTADKVKEDNVTPIRSSPKIGGVANKPPTFEIGKHFEREFNSNKK